MKPIAEMRMLRKETMEKKKRIFTYEEALELFPQVRDRTTEAVESIEQLLGDSDVEDEVDEESQPSAAYQKVVTDWAEEMVALGLEVKGLWLVDFDSGSGYYCWRYPEPGLEFFHTYDEGFRGRVKLN